MFSVFLKGHLLTNKFFTFLIGSTYLTCKVGQVNFFNHKELKNKNIKFQHKEYEINLPKKSEHSEINKNEDKKIIPNYSLYSTENFKFLTIQSIIMIISYKGSFKIVENLFLLFFLFKL